MWKPNATPRPIVVPFLHWEGANTIRSKALRAMKHNPPKGKDGTVLDVFVDQMYKITKITEAKNKAFKKTMANKAETP